MTEINISDISEIHPIKKPLRPDFRVHYWKSAYISESRIELEYGMSRAYIYPNGEISFNGGTMPITMMYHLINEAQAVCIFYFLQKKEGQ